MDLPCRVLKTTTADGLEIDALLFESKKPSKNIVIHFHGKEGDFIQNHFIEQMAKIYPANNYAFITATHRGKSYIADIIRKSTTGYDHDQLGSAFDIFEDNVYDIDAWIKFAEKLGFTNIILQQHSTPAKIAWYYYQYHPQNIKGLVFLSPGDVAYGFNKYVPNYQKNLKLAKKLIDSGQSKQLMPVNLWGNCPVSAATFYNWGNPKSPMQEFNYSHPESGFKYLPKIKIPMLTIFSEDEENFSIGQSAEKSLEIMQQNVGSKKLKTAVIKNTGHNYSGQESQLVKTILHWLKTTIFS